MGFPLRKWCLYKMENFNFYNPTSIFFGENSVAQLSNLVTTSKTLILYGGGSIKKNGTYEKVIKALGDKEFVEFGGITPNPTFEKAVEAIEFARENKVDFILAVGGGSVIDCAKFVSAGINFHHKELKHLLLTDADEISYAVPFGVVLTLPATGSEMNSGSVITYQNVKIAFSSEKVYPKFSILDPTLTFTLDQRQIGNGIVDAYVHVLEQYLTYPVNAPLQDRMAESILKTLLEEGPKTFNNPTNYEARANMMWCASMALNSLIGVGVPSDWSTHGIGHQLTSLYGIDHARTLALVWGKNMRLRRVNKMEKMLQYAKRVFDIDITNQEEAFDIAIDKTNAFFESVGVPTEFSAYSNIGADLPFKMITHLKQLKILTLGEKEDLNLANLMQLFKL